MEKIIVEDILNKHTNDFFKFKEGEDHSESALFQVKREIFTAIKEIVETAIDRTKDNLKPYSLLGGIQAIAQMNRDKDSIEQIKGEISYD